MLNIKTATFIVALLSVITSTVMNATPVTLRELSVSPANAVNITSTGFYSGDALAGIVNLSIDNAPKIGLCIDPFHFSTGTAQTYNSSSLSSVLGATKANDIGALWSQFYSPSITGNTAAGLQLAVWEIVGGNNFQWNGNDHGAAAMLATLPNYTGPITNFTAYTNGTYQDYATPDISAVPEAGSTAYLMIGACLLMLSFRYRASVYLRK